MVTGLLYNTSERLLTRGLERLGDDAPLGRILPGTFGKVTAETSPAVDARSYLSVLSVTIPCLEESCDRSPVGLVFLFTARPLVGERERRGNLPARPFDAETKQVENSPQKVFGQQSTPKNLNRWYDASVGRWLSEDPGGFNLYRYVGNGPISSRDPRGWMNVSSLQAGPAIVAHAYVVNKNWLIPDTVEVHMLARVYASCDDCGNVCYHGHNTEVILNKWDEAQPGNIQVTQIWRGNRRGYQVEWVDAQAREGDSSFGEYVEKVGGIAGGVAGSTVATVIAGAGGPGAVPGAIVIGVGVGIAVHWGIWEGGYVVEEMFDLEATWQFRWQWWLTCEKAGGTDGRWNLAIVSRPETLIFATNSWSNQYDAKYESE